MLKAVYYLFSSRFELQLYWLSPTWWQKSKFPAGYHHKIKVIHEGIGTSQAKPNPDAQVILPDGRSLTRNDPVLTYVARNLEPYRGFPQFMRALEIVQQQHPTVQTLIVGGDDVSYGSKPKDAANWREKMLREVNIEPCRTHFLGKIPYQQYLNVLQISSVHVYLTYPFVLSWSLLEAMACGCNIIASDTAPVREVIRHGENGVLVDFFAVQDFTERMILTLSSPPMKSPNAARYASAIGLTRYLKTMAEID